MRSGQPGINGQQYASLMLPLPPTLEEQKAIAGALSDVDGLIARLEALIAKKRSLKIATMQQLLTGKTRLPGFGEGVGVKQTELGEIPEDWSAATVGPLLLSKPTYGINAAAVPLSGDIPTYIRITDINDDGRFSPSPPVGVSSSTSGDYILEKDDLVFARTGASVGKSYKYDERDGRLVYAGFLIKISPDSTKLDSEYFFQYVRTKTYWNWVKQNSMRSGQPGINGKQYATLRLPLPPTLDEQKAIGETLSDLDGSISALEAELSKTKALKQGMMQELLTGRTRLI